MSQHTEGPWTVAVGCVDDVARVTGILAGPTWVVANTECPIENVADACLIAASPSLLHFAELVELAMDLVEKDGHITPGLRDHLRDKARLVIAVATATPEPTGAGEAADG